MQQSVPNETYKHPLENNELCMLSNLLSNTVLKSKG